ncbi:alginate lyase family protein [Clostridium sp. JN-9]|uniref:alginate lyase family protein n=1 Tax=Clostridium sp. JN-9 TaxID=2507159 RepID=UPI000FFE32F9|nr:alginate lyase family protein [Clostridium sp. JN-9]QAT40504.1 hypothetical protein EQM05_09650 [Clostridium sp. JN-9]
MLNMIIKLRNLTLKKAVRKLYNKILYSIRKIKMKNNPIVMETYFFTCYKPNCSFLYNPNNKDYFVSELNNLHLCSEIINSAGKICSHEFNLLGSGDIYLGEKLPWNEDFKTGFKWESKFYKDIKIVDLNNNADVKVPWELSRFQHLFTLGKAYWITNDEKYAEEFKEEVQDWIEQNPVECSVNWTCTMDVSIRAVNLICAYYFFSGSLSIGKDFWNKFNNLLYTHGKFIYKNLENQQQYNTNHYLSDLAGLIWLGLYFVECNQAAPDICHVECNQAAPDICLKWLRFGLRGFENEIQRQINEDGTDYEGSTSYHRLVTEIFLITTIFCNKNHIYFSKDYMTKLEKMCEFLMNITKPNGLSPVIGDADDGRFLILSNYSQWNKRDFSNVLAVAGEYFNRDDFKTMGRYHSEDAIWTMGSFKAVHENFKLSSKAYDTGGYYILRNNRFYCIVTCGQIYAGGQGGHIHNHQLSIELNVDGQDFIIDAGAYIYTADYKMRNLFRSTKMHNTLYINNFEQNDFSKYDLFYMKEQSFGKCTLFNDENFHGLHYGYKEKCGAIHERKINLLKNELIITDNLIGNKVSNAFVNFQLDYGVEIEEKPDKIVLSRNGIKIALQCSSKYSIQDSFVSYGYGQKLAAKNIAYAALDNMCSIKIKVI